MQNEFEKEVQRKMDELRFQPSVPVWEGVEAAIRQKRNRRRMLILIPFLLFLGLGGGLVLNNEVFKTGTTAERERETEREREKRIERKEIASEKETGKEVAKENAGIINSGKEAEPVMAEGSKSDKVQRTGSGSGSSALKANNTITGRVSKNNVAPPQKKNDEFYEDVARIEVVKNENKVISKDAADGEKEKEKEKEKEEEKEDSAAISNVDTTKLPAVAKSLKKLKWGVVASGGISSESAGLQLGQEKVAYADVTQGGATTGGFGNGSGQIPSNASPIRPALSFSVGVSAEKELSKKVFINASLMYSYFSNYRQVGNYISDSLGGSGMRPEAYYSNSGSRINTASNRFNFISLPINLRFIAFDKLSIEAGGGISYLLSSKAYTFDSFANGYYATDGVNKVQAFANVGVSYAVFKKGSRELRLGPSLQYNLSNWTKYETGRHLYSASLSAKYFFN